MTAPSALETLDRALPPYRVSLDAAGLARLRTGFVAWLRRGGPGSEEHHELVFFLLHEVRELLEEQAGLRAAHEAFNRFHGATSLPRERRRLVLEFAGQLGQSRAGLIRDAASFGRWFGADAVNDRYRNRIGDLDRHLALVLERLGHAVEVLLEFVGPNEDEVYAAWMRTRLEESLQPVLAYEGDPRVQQATFACLARAIRGLPSVMRESALNEGTLRFVYRSALESRLSVWIQAEAMDLLGEMSTSSFVTAVRLHFERQDTPDTFFVRARIVPLLLQHITDIPLQTALMRQAVMDRSPLVRQAAANALQHLPRPAACENLEILVEDPEPSVRASVLAQLPILIEPDRWQRFAELLEQRTADTEEPLVARVALELIRDVHAALEDEQAQAMWRERMVAHLAERHAHAASTRVRRWAAQAAESLWLDADPRRVDLFERLHEALEGLEPGQRRRLSLSLLEDLSIADLGRIMALLALNDHGFDVEFTRDAFHVTRGHRFGTRLWRLLFEWRHAATDKRQGFRHTIGRHFDGTLIAPSTIMCELAETKVPGEPLFIEDEDGWRPFLPLVDNVLASLDRGLPLDPIQISTTEGITEIRPPARWLDRLRARWTIARRFPELSQRRNWRADDTTHDPGAFVAALQQLGFSIAFSPRDWQADAPDDRITRFFPSAHAGLALPVLVPEIVDRAKDYFYSLYQNTLGHLTVFLLATGTLFFGQHLAAHLRIRAARRSIALVIGGWGTRGKSGTERLKAGLFNGLGYTLVSKTTGCEAMFIYARSFGRAREMFLFRPYDKATIWEQADLLKIARGLGTEVFLWECMALTPSYVEILQRQWMRDDYSTVTNAYPDHEDIQGPAGINIPEVIGRFIPRRSTVLTTEEYMLPVLRSEARRARSRMIEVGWREALLLTPDVLERFPYDEHPYNIALVASMSRMLGIEADFALKEMADRVIPDLGVLKTFPEALVATRRLEFVNGMSANERFGCLSNWRRVGLDREDPVEHPDVWVSTVVNNRADRVARSRVFASILVRDLQADRHVLIGTNLDGLSSYIDEAWQEEMGDFSLGDRAATTEGRIEAVQHWLERMRVPHREAHLNARLRAMATGVGLDPASELDDTANAEALLAACTGASERVRQEFTEWAGTLHAQFESANALLAAAADPEIDRSTLETRVAEQLRSWFDEKLVVIEDAGASGEAVIAQIVKATPPGLRNRVMGMQNIKGTGLDFVYRWLAWETVHEACMQLRSADARERDQGGQTLAGFQEYGLLSEQTVRDAVEAAREDPAMQREAVRAQLATIEQTVDEAIAALGDLHAGPRQARRRAPWLELAEQILDSFDAVLRRRRADRIYQDLVAERVSPERAALELQRLNKRQKGGWLQQSVRPVATAGDRVVSQT